MERCVVTETFNGDMYCYVRRHLMERCVVTETFNGVMCCFVDI